MTPVHERYVKYPELADLMGVCVRTLNRWVAVGMPSETWGLGHTRRFLPSACIGWAHLRGLIEARVEVDENNVLGRMTTAEPHRKE